MNETNDVTFISSSAQFYQWVSENDPSKLAEIKKRVDEGRWNIVGGWWIEPDVNIPCGESLVRQGLYGQMTLHKLLGHRAKVAFNPDSFGHTGTLPQIIKLQGMENYIFMRPASHEKSIPSDLFWWEGTDGTRVLTYRIQFSYNDNASVRSRIENILAQSENQPMKSYMAYYGAGDHGGGATKENIRSIEELMVERGAPSIFYSTPEKYFEEVRSCRNLNIPVYRGDLQHHAAGCYTAESAIKKGNRHSEAALITAEKLAAILCMSILRLLRKDMDMPWTLPIKPFSSLFRNLNGRFRLKMLLHSILLSLILMPGKLMGLLNMILTGARKLILPELKMSMVIHYCINGLPGQPRPEVVKSFLSKQKFRLWDTDS
jgi:alpha-mannosidase